MVFTEYNAKDFVSAGGLKELIRISVESSREDIRNLANKTLKSSPTFRAAVDAEWSRMCMYVYKISTRLHDQLFI